MDTNKLALTQCLELSRNINKLGLGINSKRSSCEVFTTLVQSSATLGELITAIDYIPLRSYRLNMTIDAMKEVSKVIYLLNVANGSDMFIANDVNECVESAIQVSKLLNAILMGFTTPVKKPEEQSEQDSEKKPEQQTEELQQTGVPFVINYGTPDQPQPAAPAAPVAPVVPAPPAVAATETEAKPAKPAKPEKPAKPAKPAKAAKASKKSSDDAEDGFDEPFEG